MDVDPTGGGCPSSCGIARATNTNTDTNTDTNANANTGANAKTDAPGPGDPRLHHANRHRQLRRSDVDGTARLPGQRGRRFW